MVEKKRFDGDKCPCCGEPRDVEYGHVYAENGVAWHSATCLKCDAQYSVFYRFEGIDGIEHGRGAW